MPGGESQIWASKVNRIILLAGMNRGWSTDSKPRDKPLWKHILMWIGAHVSQLTHTARMIHGVRRGAPFITNLRIQWLNLRGTLPKTIQLLGDVDDIVSQQDNLDVEGGADFVYLPVPNTGHEDVVRFDGARGEIRAGIFRKALLTPISELRGVPLTGLKPDDTVKHFVFVAHGIRDGGFWTSELAKQIEAAANPGEVRTWAARYGYFPMGDFLLLAERQKNVRWLMNEYTDAMAMYPQARFSFVGHSNGTYLLASALRRYKACAFHRVVFAGSVVPRNFEWDRVIRVENRVIAIRNYVASADWVVGIFPRVFEYRKHPDLGSAGLWGFEEQEGKRYEVAFVKGSHSAALDPGNYHAIASFILNEVPESTPPKLVTTEQAGWVVNCSKFAFLIWIGMIWLLSYGLYMYVTLGSYPHSAWMRAVLYLALLLSILKNV